MYDSVGEVHYVSILLGGKYIMYFSVGGKSIMYSLPGPEYRYIYLYTAAGRPSGRRPPIRPPADRPSVSTAPDRQLLTPMQPSRLKLPLPYRPATVETGNSRRQPLGY